MFSLKMGQNGVYMFRGYQGGDVPLSIELRIALELLSVTGFSVFILLSFSLSHQSIKEKKERKVYLIRMKEYRRKREREKKIKRENCF